jgi:hypothetical protein
MHFLGIAGMPRRIVEYPSAFSSWNEVSSFGAFISLSATIIFFITVLEALLIKRKSKNAFSYLSVSVIYPAEKFVYVMRRDLGRLREFVRQNNIPSLYSNFVVVIDKPYDIIKPIKVVNASGLLLSIITLPGLNSNLCSFQTPVTPIMQGIVNLHNDIMFYLVIVVVFCLYLLISGLIISSEDVTKEHGYLGDNKTHNSLIEVI